MFWKLNCAIRSGILLLLLLPAFGMPSEVYAASSGTTVGTLTLVPTIECIGVAASYTNDDDRDNSAVLEYRQVDTGGWKTAPPMYADREAGDGEYRGSIFWLTTNTNYEVRVTFTDADGVIGTNPVSATTKTKNDNPPSIGATYYVATTGSDSNLGTEAYPFMTIQKAADSVTAGATVLVKAGTYSENIHITRSGTVNNYITFKPSGSDAVLLDGNGTLPNLFYLDGADYVRIKGFTIANSSNSSAIYIDNSDYTIIEDNVIQDPNKTAIEDWTEGGIRICYGSYGSIIQRNTISVNAGLPNNTFGIAYWESDGGYVIRNNVITSNTGVLRDGFGGGPESYTDPTSDVDIYNNTVRGARDDGLQIEGGDVNARVWNNRIEDSFMGIALAGNRKGPAYIFRNVVINTTVATDGTAEYKLGSSHDGRTYFYHNTYYTNQPNGDGYFQTDSGLHNIVSRNNIVHAGKYVIETRDGSGHDFDYDNLYTTSTSRFIKWDGTTYASLGAFRTAIGQEQHGISANSQFTNPASGDFTLQATSPNIDKGVLLLGFNDASSPWAYTGDAPDIGAYEYKSAATNHPPVLAAIGNKSVNEGQLLQFTISATDSDGDALTYSAFNLPSGATFNTGTRTFSWTPAFGQAGSYPDVRFQASDGSVADYELITITVPTGSDTKPSQIGGVTVSEITSNSAVISWTTDEPATSQVEYRASLSKFSSLDEKLVTSHVVRLTDLASGAVYYYKALSRDKAGNLSTSEEYTFTTLKSPASTPPQGDGEKPSDARPEPAGGTPEATPKVVDWTALSMIIGATLIVIIATMVVALVRRRGMLRGYVDD